MSILELLHSHPPRYGPEWGSGGIFGLKYHRGFLYYTLAFEGEAHFVSKDGVRITYDFALVGPPPTSGGDTYNAVDAVDDTIFFGGWVHAPAVYKGEGRISFVNKYSHVHYFDTSDLKVRLLWREGLGHEELWAGEVTDLIYNPVRDELLAARGDGHDRLGVYSIDMKGRSSRISDRRSLKGAILADYACFDYMDPETLEVRGVHCYNLATLKGVEVDLESAPSVDGVGPASPVPGVVASSHGRLMVFVRGGVFVGDPLGSLDDPMKFVRLLDLGASGYGPFRTMAKSVGGGVLVAFNSYTHAVRRTYRGAERVPEKEALDAILAPTLLLYITPPTARIVGVLGARVTGLELVGDKILLATNTDANYMRLDATPIDTGHRGFIALPQETLQSTPPPARIHFRLPEGWGRTFGGIPLEGYKRPEFKVEAGGDATLYVAEYDLAMPHPLSRVEKYQLARGWNVIDLSGFGNSIVSFRVEGGGLLRALVDLK